MRKILLALLIVGLVCLTAVGADKYAPQAAFDWSDSWCDSDDGVQDVVKPGIGDVAIFTLNSGDCELDETTAALGGLTFGVGTSADFDFNGNTIDVDGTLTFDTTGTISDTGGGGQINCSGDVVITAAPLPAGITVELDGTGNVAASHIGNSADVVVDTSGTHTATAVSYWGSFTGTGGTYDVGGFNHIIDTDITAGSVTYLNNTGMYWEITGTGTVTGGGGSSDTPGLKATGTVTLGGVFVQIDQLLGSGTIDGGAYLKFEPPRDDVWSFDGTFGASHVEYRSDSGTITSGLAWDTGDTLLLVSRSAGLLVADAAIDTGTARLELQGDGAASNLDMGAFGLTCDDIRVANDTHAAGLNLGSGSHTFTGTVARGASWSGGVASIEFSTCDITLTGGTINGTNITSTSDGTNTHAVVHGGTVQNVSIPIGSQALDCTDNVTDGGSNVNVWLPSVMGVHSLIGGGMIGSGEAQ